MGLSAQGRRGVLGPVVVGCEETVPGSLWCASEGRGRLHGGRYVSEEGGEIDRRAR